MTYTSLPKSKDIDAHVGMRVAVPDVGAVMAPCVYVYECRARKKDGRLYWRRIDVARTDEPYLQLLERAYKAAEETGLPVAQVGQNERAWTPETLALEFLQKS